MSRRLVIANRGEIARRILRAARGRGYTIAVVSTLDDAESLVRREADAVLEVSGFLALREIVDAAIGWQAQLLHPGYGFLAENADFARAVEDAGGTAGTGRSALTTIYFLLVEGEVSRWHRLDADELWHFYEGAPLELFLLDAAGLILTRTRLGPAASGTALVHVAPAGSWLAARPLGAFALVGCTMGPGFEAAGFALLKDAPDAAVDVVRRFPEAADLL